MKNSVILASLFFSSVSFADCPDLSSSTKNCRSMTGQINGSIDQVISQEKINGETTYTITSTSPKSGETVTKTLIADGKSRREMEVDENSGITLLTVTTVRCLENSLLSHETSFIDGQFLGIMDVETSKSQNKVTSVYEGIRWGRDVDDTIVCE